MLFKGIQKTSLIEYPGKIATVVFVGGCCFNCPICHNRDLVLNSDELPDITEDEVLNHLDNRKGKIEAVAITGGEPTLQSDLIDFIKKVKARDLFVELETNGINPVMVKDLIKSNLIDYWAMDIKAPLSEPEKYHRIIGRIGEIHDIIDKVRETAQLIKNSGIDYEFRTTYAPELLTEEDFVKIAHDLKGAKRYAIQGFRPVNNLNPEFNSKLNWPPAVFERLAGELEKYFGEVIVRN